MTVRIGNNFLASFAHPPQAATDCGPMHAQSPNPLSFDIVSAATN